MHFDKSLEIIRANTIWWAAWVREWKYLVDVLEVEVAQVRILTQLQNLHLVFDFWVFDIVVAEYLSLLWHNWDKIYHWWTHLGERNSKTHVKEDNTGNEKQSQVEVIAIMIQESDIVS